MKQESKPLLESYNRLFGKMDSFDRLGIKKPRLDEATGKWQIEAYGVKGMKSVSWRKIFNSPEQLEKWCDANDAEVQGTSYLLDGREIRSSMPEYQNLPDNFKGE